MSDEVDYDLACAVALGLVECDCFIANVNQLTVLDDELRTIGVISNWLDPNDQLHALTRDYLITRSTIQSAMTKGYGHQQAAWKLAGTVKVRELAATRANEIRNTARLLLHERGVMARAKDHGYKLFL